VLESPPAGRIADLNADVGESFGRWVLGDDDALLGVVSSANVACGFHAGDPSTLRRACGLAADRGVAVGAQVGYRDLAGFGRRFIEMSFAELRDDVLYQLGALSAFCQVAGTKVTYVKPHGALYHAVSRNADQASAVVAAIRDFDPGLAVLGAPGSTLLEHAAGAGLAVAAEGFADRGYAADGSLLPRSALGSVLSDPVEIGARALRMVTQGDVVAADGSTVAVAPRSVCVHGDTPGAVGIARAVRSALEDAGVEVRAFAPPPERRG
jgi:5-oxoprolinase (ATP-hydrolysing) subunit A